MDADPAASISAGRRWLILIAVVLGSSLYSTALLTTSTILPQMQGALSATQDEIAWVMTFNILATAVVTPMTGWLVARFGAKQRDGVGILPASRSSTLLCGLAQIARGAGGLAHRAGRRRRAASCRCRRPSCSTPSRAASRRWCSRSSAWPSASRPCMGPVLGGYLAEAYSWRWSFYMLVPVGVIAFIALRLALPGRQREGREGAARLDRVSGARDRHVRGATRAGARRSPRLVRIDRDHPRMR